MAFLRGYFDESGKHAADRVVSFCGFVDAEWSDFECEWNSLLRRHKLPALHLSKEKLKATAQQLQMYQGFIQVISRTVEHGFACAVDARAFDQMHKSVRSLLGNDAHYMAFSTVVMDVVKYAAILPQSPTVSLICDEDQEKACDTYRAYRKCRDRNPESRQVLKSIAFAEDTYYPQLQAADLLSWVARAEALHRFCAEEFSLRGLYREFNLVIPGRKIEYTSSFWGKENLEKFGRSTAADLAKLRR